MKNNKFYCNYYYYYYNSAIVLNLKQYYSKHFTVHKIQYTCVKNWHNEIKISNWKTSPNQKVYIQHIEFYRAILETFVWQTRKRWKF